MTYLSSLALVNNNWCNFYRQLTACCNYDLRFEKIRNFSDPIFQLSAHGNFTNNSSPCHCVLEKVDPKLRFPQLMATTSKGRSQTRLTSFWAFFDHLSTLGWHWQRNSFNVIRENMGSVDISIVPTTFCQCSLWTTPKVALARLQQLKYHLLKPPSLTIYYFTQIYIIAFKAISLLCTRIQPHNGLAWLVGIRILNKVWE